MLFFTFLSLLHFIPSILAWGAVGHEIVAVIAEIHLFPSTKEQLKTLIPKGSLAPIASWADKIKFANRWSSSLHYANSVDDYPPERCSFPGKSGWTDDRNIFSAIGNYTDRLSDSRLSTTQRSDALKFLVHFIGDLHQPLHIAGRDKGGNGDPVMWGGRHTNLHSLWDGLLIARALRDLHNYTQPLPSDQIEDVLKGAIYDSYVRWIIWEGVRVWWKKDINDWIDCSSTHVLGQQNSQQIFSPSGSKTSKFSYADSPDSCSVEWATEIHKTVTCPLAFPPLPYDKDTRPLPDLSGKWYNEVKKDKTLEKVLAMGGLRLAYILNNILGDPEEMKFMGDSRGGIYNLV